VDTHHSPLRNAVGATKPVQNSKLRFSMITALIQFKLPKPLTREQARETFLSTAPRYRGTPGLIRKYYLLSQDGGTAGGVYLWKSREDAERLYTDNWKAFILEKYGALPSVTYFDSPVVVDNVTQEIVSDE
jgi:hypothetical protein